MDFDEIVERVTSADEMPKAEKAELLQALKDHLLECHSLAAQLVSDDERAKGYWLAGFRCLLDQDHMYLDRQTTMQDTIDEYREWEGDDDEYTGDECPNEHR